MRNARERERERASEASESSSTCFRVRIKLMPLLRNQRVFLLGRFLPPRQRVYNYICLRISLCLQFLTFLVDVLRRIRRRRLRNKRIDFEFSDFAIRFVLRKINCDRLSEGRTISRETSFFDLLFEKRR